MSRITYLLGAGASAQAMPVVSELPLAIKFVKIYIKYLSIIHQIDLSKTIENVYHLEHLTKTTLSIDTLFRRLFLIRDNNHYYSFKINENEITTTQNQLLWIYNVVLLILEYKEVLNIRKSIEQNYNLFLQIVSDEKIDLETVLGILNNKNNDIDVRYENFISTVFDKKTKKLDDRISILTWNYDLQFERVYKLYRELDNYNELINELKNNKVFYKLNGTSFNDSLLYSLDDISETELLDILKTQNRYRSNIFFNWSENKAIEREDYFKSLADTEILIVIGYSFPNFNRDTDTKFLQTLMSLRKVYIIDIENKINDTNIAFNSLLLRIGRKTQFHKSLNDKDTSYYNRVLPTELITSTSQFFIPPEY